MILCEYMLLFDFEWTTVPVQKQIQKNLDNLHTLNTQRSCWLFFWFHCHTLTPKNFSVFSTRKLFLIFSSDGVKKSPTWYSEPKILSKTARVDGRAMSVPSEAESVFRCRERDFAAFSICCSVNVAYFLFLRVQLLSHVNIHSLSLCYRIRSLACRF